MANVIFFFKSCFCHTYLPRLTFGLFLNSESTLSKSIGPYNFFSSMYLISGRNILHSEKTAWEQVLGINLFEGVKTGNWSVSCGILNLWRILYNCSDRNFKIWEIYFWLSKLVILCFPEKENIPIMVILHHAWNCF